MSDLCWKCREGWKVTQWPWTHCHHEQREKPKCWCERFHIFNVITMESRIEATIRYCPECGRKLERKEVRKDEG